MTLWRLVEVGQVMRKAVTGEHTGLELNRPDLSPVSTD